MSSPAASQSSSIFQHLRAIKKTLQDMLFDAKIATSLEMAEVDVLERGVFDLLYLVQSWRNRFAPISKIPPEILALVPDFLDPNYRDQGIITLTHVCRAWRGVFVSRSSLWTDFDFKNGDKTQVYLERSTSSPINLSLYRPKKISSRDPFFRVIPHAIGRLRFLSVKTRSENIQAIAPHLSYPAPLLEHLAIDGNCKGSGNHPALTPALFNGDLSSLRTLHLESVYTKLPWRNMVNLTSFTLAHMPPEEVTIRQLLDFFEGAPRLCEVTLHHATPTTGAQYGRLVSLVCLKNMDIDGGPPFSVLLEHLVIPVGAKLTTRADLVGGHFPRSLENLRNLSNFTIIQLYLDGADLRMKFSGPNGEVSTTAATFRANRTDLALESLAQLDTSKTKRLEITGGNTPPRNTVYQALLPMTDLRILMLFKCRNPSPFIHVLRPGMSASEVVVCPELEELVLVLCVDGEKFGIRGVVEMAAARALRGKKLRTIRIVDGRGKGKADLNVLELRKHVRSVEYSRWDPRL